MSEWLESLQVGDKVYFDSRTRRGIYTIERVTSTQIILPNDVKIRRSNGFQITGDTYNTGSIRSVTPEIVESIRHANRLHFVAHKVEWDKLPPEIITQIYELIKGLDKSQTLCYSVTTKARTHETNRKTGSGRKVFGNL